MNQAQYSFDNVDQIIIDVPFTSQSRIIHMDNGGENPAKEEIRERLIEVPNKIEERIVEKKEEQAPHPQSERDMKKMSQLLESLDSMGRESEPNPRDKKTEEVRTYSQDFNSKIRESALTKKQYDILDVPEPEPSFLGETWPKKVVLKKRGKYPWLTPKVQLIALSSLLVE